jgi:hypothetical protein
MMINVRDAEYEAIPALFVEYVHVVVFMYIILVMKLMINWDHYHVKPSWTEKHKCWIISF